MSMADRIAVLQHGRVEQLDAPVELYEHPRSLFVARFIGTNNLFLGVVSAGGVQVDTIGWLPASETTLAPGDAAYLGIRPEHLDVVDDGAMLGGEVIDTQFYGGLSSLAVAVAGRREPVVVTQQGVTRVTRGTTVGLAWDPARAVVLPA